MPNARVAVFASGTGTDLQSILDAIAYAASRQNDDEA